MMMKNIFVKATLDTLDFIEYFCATDSLEPVWTFVGQKEAEIALRTQTMSQQWANKLAKRVCLPPPELDPYVPIRTMRLLMNRCKPVNEDSDRFLTKRRLPQHCVERYALHTYRPSDHSQTDLQGVSSFYLFNHERLEYLSFVLNHLGTPIDLLNVTWVVAPSYDRHGHLNCLAFRTCSSELEPHCKWVFSHGRCATFGLNLVFDTKKPVTLVEGLFDQIACNELGFSQPVGLGSAFISDEHHPHLEELENVWPMFDSDEVGQRYTHLAAGMKNVQGVYRLHSAHKDPYDWWANEGRIDCIEAPAV
jgi:hypothetical protein